MLKDGDPAPDVTVQTPDGASVKLFSQFGAPMVLYFYPKDDTSGCTREAQDFNPASNRVSRLRALPSSVFRKIRRRSISPSPRNMISKSA